MSLNLVKLNIEYISLKSISMSLDPPIKSLSKSEVNMFLGNKKFYDYELVDTSQGTGKLYKIIPYDKFTIYDFITLEIITPNYNSNKVKIYIVKHFEDGKANIDLKFSENKQGIYSVKLSSVNETKFNLKTSPITVSLPLDVELCDAKLEGGETYNVNDDIKVNVELYNILGEHVLNGNYEVELSLEDRE